MLSNASGGAAISTVELMRALRSKGIRSAAVCHPAGSREERQAIVDATEGNTLFTILYYWNRKFRTPWLQRSVKEIKQGSRTGWARWSARRVAEHASVVKADLIHTNTILTPEGGLAARWLGLPHVWHLRDLLGPGAWIRLPLEGRSLGSFLASRCSKLVANSETAAAAIRDGLPDGLLAVVPNGIDVTRFTAERATASDKIVVGMVANLTSHVKKHWLFVEAAGRVDRALPVEFRIYGADPTQGGRADAHPYVLDLQSRIARCGLGDRFRFQGSRKDPVDIMKEIDILVHTADVESFGRIVAEAMAASRPVVGVRQGGVAELVEDGVTGLLAVPDDPADISAQLQCLISNPHLRIELGAAGRRRVEARYSLEAHVARMLDVYAASMQRPLGEPSVWKN